MNKYKRNKRINPARLEKSSAIIIGEALPVNYTLYD